MRSSASAAAADAAAAQHAKHEAQREQSSARTPEEELSGQPKRRADGLRGTRRGRATHAQHEKRGELNQRLRNRGGTTGATSGRGGACHGGGEGDGDEGGGEGRGADSGEESQQLECAASRPAHRRRLLRPRRPRPPPRRPRRLASGFPAEALEMSGTRGALRRRRPQRRRRPWRRWRSWRAQQYPPHRPRRLRCHRLRCHRHPCRRRRGAPLLPACRPRRSWPPWLPNGPAWQRLTRRAPSGRIGRGR